MCIADAFIAASAYCEDATVIGERTDFDLDGEIHCDDFVILAGNYGISV